MKKVKISEVGGLNTKVLARMGGNGIAILTSANVPSAVALPYIGSRKKDNSAAQQYIALADKSIGGKSPVSNVTRVGRLTMRLISELRKHGSLAVSLRGELVAILLPFPQTQAEANQNIEIYLKQ